MFQTDDVIDLVREASVVFADEAVFATASSSARNGGAKCLANVTGHERVSGAPWL